MNNIIYRLEKILEERKKSDPDESYVSSLYRKGNDYICHKIIEESKELIDSSYENKENMIHETADLLFHVLVLLASHDIKYDTILNELEKRFGTSGIEEKNNRKR
ncbi:MAG: phosphoribosyl-ATP diphosphatase [Gammaproteobacteria bacterium]|nr:phosphoribosyl-ATP diphosphatase [Gammaproteobacteria bacterium]MBL6819287.1 phosphoribosyl-ATP diphosphatase [Gammaproteobacteria bacterium]MBL6898466.1 phosphoribosyl-ATP diphosphatase [Gammaproteobacteria bacterium]